MTTFWAAYTFLVEGMSSTGKVHAHPNERRVSEAALRRSESLALVGRMASSIAHEISNPLEAVPNLA
ncbi:MAG: hypothetical protein QOH35_3795 [Acidobacteriaceae bacterium]|jgi:C4-dicarboxylate-specific signal transduction histidine kinase|nr:hypothetical protein [Acidobacteriaceae bacterium]MEA3007319.1 hypothetical protein [Acidobacteriaceae bacterium]